MHAKRSYVGHTEEIENRIKRHNKGYVRSTKAYRLWILIRKELYSTRSEAMKRETLLKSPIGRKLIAKFIEEWQEKGLSVPLSATTERDRDPARAGSD